MLQIFYESSCLGSAKKQVKESKVVCPHLSYAEGGWSLLMWSPPEAKGPAWCPAAKPRATTQGRTSPFKFPLCNLGTSRQETTALSLSNCISLTDDRKEMLLKEQRADIIFYFIINCTRYCIFVQIQMSQTSECPLFAPHRSLLNQTFLIL